MTASKVLILRAPGTNCDAETAFAFERAGGAAETVHLNRWLESPHLADDCQIVCIPGGFSYGDDVAAGTVAVAGLSFSSSNCWATSAIVEPPKPVAALIM